MHKHCMIDMQCAHQQPVAISSEYAHISGSSDKTDARGTILKTRLLEAKPLWALFSTHTHDIHRVR